MAFEEPARPRFTVEEKSDGLTINIPSKRRWFLVVFLSFWLCGWAVGEVFVAGLLLYGLFVGDGLWQEAGNAVSIGLLIFMLAWLGGWTVGGLFAMYAWLWNIAGRQIVTVGVDGIRIENAVPMWRRGKEYRLTDVRSLRVAPEQLTMWTFRQGMRFWGIGGGPLAFDYGAKTVRFGPGTDEAEAEMILAAIARRCPRICRTGESAQ